MFNEIGSEFWEADLLQYERPFKESSWQALLSGRTALDFIINDIKTKNTFNAVCLPSYSCHTMIQPFLENGIHIGFYEIGFKNNRYTYQRKDFSSFDAVLVMGYFGFRNEEKDSLIKLAKKEGKIVIEDATHSWFSDKPYSAESNYIFASFRKWTGLPCGAIAIKQEEDFLFPSPSETNWKYIEMRTKAAEIKKQFIEQGAGGKEDFLALFRASESLLENDYKNYTVPKTIKSDIAKLDYEKIKQKRRINASLLIEKLKDIKDISTPKLSDTDVPLFVPAMLSNEKRDDLQKYLIKNQVYCPVHWPFSDLHRVNDNSLYRRSISLICDQRYDTEDMDRIADKITDFLRQI